MGAITFPSRWGPYNVTRVTLACEPEPLTGTDGTITQRVATFEANDMSEAMTVTLQTLFKSADGRLRHVCYDGQQRTMLKPRARQLYRRLTSDGYSLDLQWLEAECNEL
jgi:hypothetical protein